MISAIDRNRPSVTLLRTALLGTALLACSQSAPSSEQRISYEQFRASVYQEPGTGIFIVDGDVPILGEEALRSFFDATQTPSLGTLQQGLTVSRVNGVPTMWQSGLRGNLTYCINPSFGARYALVRDTIAAAASEWAAATNYNIRFVHTPSQDATCTSTNPYVVFDVQPVTSTGFLLAAFFPDFPREHRTLRIDDYVFINAGPPITFAGHVRHELGHILGFKHEHVRLSSGPAGCTEEGDYEGLTYYDSASVMHYPGCNGTQTGDLVLTAYDKAGAAKLYPYYFTQLSGSQWVRLTNNYMGPTSSLDTYPNGPNTPIMEFSSNNFAGQYWFLQDEGFGRYRLTNLQLGGSRSFDIYSTLPAPFMGTTGNYAGQYWNLTPDGAGCFRITNAYYGTARSLDTYFDPYNGTFVLTMAPTGNYSGQCWHLQYTNSALY